MPTYTTPTDPSTLHPPTLAAQLRATIAAALPHLHSLSEQAASTPPAPNKWSTKQILGHLCDSAMNNQQRIVRLQLEPTIALPGYEQAGWVRVQHYDLLPWSQVLTLWLTLNQHLAHTVEHLDATTLTHIWLYNNEPLTLAFILEDYIAHHAYHLQRLPA